MTNKCVTFPGWVGSIVILLSVVVAGCGDELPKPEPIYPEDACSNCRMAISQPRFASQLITRTRKAHKFDDIMCLDEFRSKNQGEVPAVIYYADYESRTWIVEGKAILLETGVSTPMGSGRIAVGDSARAANLAKQFPTSGSK